jgi:molybdenum cofactor cytidylyltransferase
MHRFLSDKIGVIILAAGGSSRMGQPKQTLPFKGKDLLQHATEVALDSDNKPVVVVLGAACSQTRKSLGNYPVTVAENHEWPTGMASSIKAGLKTIMEISPELGGVILMVCDQPYVTPHLLRKMKNAWKNSGNGIVACSYDQTMGTPALFARDYFKDLLSLEGQQGAKKILLAYQSFLSIIPFPLGKIDIDTPEDYQNLEQQPSC